MLKPFPCRFSCPFPLIKHGTRYIETYEISKSERGRAKGAAFTSTWTQPFYHGATTSPYFRASSSRAGGMPVLRKGKNASFDAKHET